MKILFISAGEIPLILCEILIEAGKVNKKNYLPQIIKFLRNLQLVGTYTYVMLDMLPYFRKNIAVYQEKFVIISVTVTKTGC